MSVIVVPTEARALVPAQQNGQAEDKGRLALSSRVYLPTCMVAVVAAVLVGIAWSSHWGGADFTGSVTSLRVIVVGPVSLVIIGAFLVIERLWPAQRRPLVARGHLHDLLFTVWNALVVLPLVTALTLSFVEVARRSLPWIVLPKMGLLPRWGAIAVILVGMDGCNWLVHLANHRVRMLWRFHELHHSQEDLNVLTVFRTHPLVHVSYLFALVPGIVLMANGALTTSLLVAYGAVVAFVHSNTRLGFGPLGRIFVSPNYHRIHHQLDGPQDVNLGFALTIWDQMFHRAVFPTTETIRADTGLPGRPLVVEQAADRPRHLYVFFAQMMAPFRPMDIRTDLPPRRSSMALSAPTASSVEAWQAGGLSSKILDAPDKVREDEPREAEFREDEIQEHEVHEDQVA